MERRNALLQLAKSLLARRAEQHEKLATELATLRNFRTSQATGDSADGAFENSSGELSSQLAQLDARELRQIERALTRLKQGTYGLCEGNSPKCQKKIPIARLKALPDSALCIHCQRVLDEHPNGIDRWDADHWGRIVDAKDPVQERQVNLSDLENALSSSWKR